MHNVILIVRKRQRSIEQCCLRNHGGIAVTLSLCAPVLLLFEMMGRPSWDSSSNLGGMLSRVTRLVVKTRCLDNLVELDQGRRYVAFV